MCFSLQGGKVLATKPGVPVLSDDGNEGLHQYTMDTSAHNAGAQLRVAALE